MATGIARLPHAERLRGCVFHEDFESATSIAANGGTITGAPTYDTGKGIRLTGTEGVTYAASAVSGIVKSGFTSIKVEAWPGFVADEAVARCLIGSEATNKLSISRTAAKALQVTIGAGTVVLSAALAAYQAYWRTNDRNVIVVASRSGGSVLYLNGVSVATSATAFTAQNITGLTAGFQHDGSEPWIGHVSSVSVYRHASAAELLTAQEAIDAYNRSTYTYPSRATCILPMGAAQHDAVGNRTLDVSGKGNHFTFGDGSTATTFPTKRTLRGYGFDGGDYLKGPAFGSFTGSICVAASPTYNSGASAIGEILDFRASGGTGYSYFNNDSTIFRSSGTVYRNSLATASYTTGLAFYCVSGMAVVSNGNTFFGVYNGLGAAFFNGSYRYMSIYPFALTPTQVANEYLLAMENARLT